LERVERSGAAGDFGVDDGAKIVLKDGKGSYRVKAAGGGSLGIGTYLRQTGDERVPRAKGETSF
jgi:hypothetical protein